MQIICPTDFSLAAHTAAQVAASLAHRLGDTLGIAHAWDPPGAVAQYPSLIADPMLDEALDRRARDELAFFAQGARAYGVPVVERSLRGYAPTSVTELARELGSAASRAAINWVGHLPHAGPCDIHFVHFYSPTVVTTEQELHPSIAHVPGAGSIALRVAPCWGSIAAALCVEASERDADALIVGIHQRSGLARLRLGSVTQHLLQNAMVPVFCIRTTEFFAPTLHDLPRFRRVLVATDLSEFGNQAIPTAYGLLQVRHAHVFLCHVHETHADTGPDEEVERQLRLRLFDLLQAEPGLRYVSTDTVLLNDETPAEAINYAATRLGSTPS